MNASPKSLRLRTRAALARLSRVTRLAPLAALCAGLTAASGASARESTLPVNAVLFAGQRLVDPNCFYHLDMQEDANLVIYAGAGTTGAQVVWASNTAGREYSPNSGWLYMQPDGNLVEYSYNVLPIWASNTVNNEASFLDMQVDGNLVVYPAQLVNGVEAPATWASHTPRASAPEPSFCLMQSSYTQTYPDTNILVGTELTQNRSGSWNSCGQQCVNTSGCTAWEYDPNGFRYGYGFCTLYQGSVQHGPDRFSGTSQFGDATVGVVNIAY